MMALLVIWCSACIAGVVILWAWPDNAKQSRYGFHYEDGPRGWRVEWDK